MALTLSDIAKASRSNNLGHWLLNSDKLPVANGLIAGPPMATKKLTAEEWTALEYFGVYEPNNGDTD